MAKPGWLNDNTFRSYPLIHGQEGNIPDCAIVDFGSTTLAGSGYIEGTHRIWVEWIRRIGNTLEFCIRSDAPGLEDQALIFQRDITDPKFVTQFTWAQTALTEEQLEEACECGANFVCNPGFDEFEDTTTTTPEPGSSSSSSMGPDLCNKYPGSAVYAWNVTSGITQANDVLKIVATGLGFEEAYQEVTAFFPGEHMKLFFDLVSFFGTGIVTISIAGPTKDDIISQISVTEPDTYTLTADVPPSGPVFVVIKVFNTSSSEFLTVEIDNVALQSCISNDSSFSVPTPPEECPADPVWEGFLVTGDIACLLEFMEDCTRAGSTPGGSGDVDVMFFTDTTGSMGGYINTIKAVFSPLATTVTQLLPNVDFRWSAVSYKDFEDGAPWSTGIKVDSPFIDSIPDVQTAINGWSAGGGGDGPEQHIATLKLAAEMWTASLGGRPGAQKVMIWGGDIIGWEDGAKGFPYPKLEETIAALTGQRIKVFGINNSGAGGGIDGLGTPSGRHQASAIIAATGGVLSNNVSQSDADKIAQIVANNIFTSASFPGEVTLSLLEGPGYMEPSRTKNLDGSYLRSFAVVNTARTTADTAEGCREYCWPFELEEHCVACECVAGPVRFKEGHNSTIRVDEQTNAIIFDAEVGAGEGPTCEEILVCPVEAPPAGRTTLDGAATCNEVVRSINGSGRRFFDLIGGQGVIVTPLPSQHRIVINIGLHDMALCPDLDPDEIATCIPPSADPCACGPEDMSSFECPDGATTPEPEPTTTTTPDPACGGPCVWSWNQPLGEETGEWEQISGACSEGCSCVEPSTDGLFHGEQRNSNCQADLPPCLLINHDLEEFDPLTGNIESITGWAILDSEGYSPDKIIASDSGFPGSMEGLSTIRMFATAAGHAEIQQNFTVVEGQQYAVTFRIKQVQGVTNYGIKVDGIELEPNDVDEVLHEDESLTVILTYTAPAGATSMTVFLFASDFLTFSGRGIIDVESVCVEELE